MNEETIMKAAKAAEKLVASLGDSTLKAAAFGVVFERLLDRPAEPRSEGITAKTKPPGPRLARNGNKAGPQSRLRDLVSEKFFQEPRSLKATLEELGERGFNDTEGTISKGLQRLVRDRVLRRKKTMQGKKPVYLYSNW